MATRSRAIGESFKAYRRALVFEQAREEEILRGRMLWTSKDGTYVRDLHGDLTPRRTAA